MKRQACVAACHRNDQRRHPAGLLPGALVPGTTQSTLGFLLDVVQRASQGLIRDIHSGRRLSQPLRGPVGYLPRFVVAERAMERAQHRPCAPQDRCDRQGLQRRGHCHFPRDFSGYHQGLREVDLCQARGEQSGRADARSDSAGNHRILLAGLASPTRFAMMQRYSSVWPNPCVCCQY